MVVIDKWSDSTMKLLVIGGTRFIGKEVVKAALQYGHDVMLFNRGKTISSPTLPLVQGDLSNLKEFKSKLTPFKPDAIIHCISNTEADAKDYVEVFSELPARSIILSSMDCYHAFQQANQGGEASDIPIDESMPTTRISHYWRGSAHTHADNYDKKFDD